MEEAEILSDRIIVIVDGDIKTSGTSLSLKNQFGYGYRINLILKIGTGDSTSELCQQLFSSVKIIDLSADSLVFSISKENTQDLEKFFLLIEKEKDLTKSE